MTWQKENIEEFKKGQKNQVKCSIEGCNENSTIAVQEYPMGIEGHQPFKFYCDEHREKG